MYNPVVESGMEGTKAVINEPQPGPPQYSQPAMVQSSYPQPGYGSPQQHQPVTGYPPQPWYPASHTSTSNTTVVIQQPQTQVMIQGPRNWSTGLCSCFDDCGVCLLGMFCPCILQCVVASNAGECCCVGGCCPIALRTKIRERHKIAGTILDDFCTLYWCGACAMCQMAREVNLHGI